MDFAKLLKNLSKVHSFKLGKSQVATLEEINDSCFCFAKQNLLYSIMERYVATVAGDDRFRCLKIKYLKRTSNKTGKVATSKKTPV